MADRLLTDQPIGPSEVVFLVGENGSGKSQRLKDLSLEILNSKKRVIAISNTTFDRFPRFRRETYMRLSPSVGSWYAKNVFRKAISYEKSDLIYNASLVAKTLQYIGFEPFLGLHAKIKDKINLSELTLTLSESIPLEEISRIARALDIYKNYRSQNHIVWINLYDLETGVDRRDLLTLLKHESILKRLRLVEGISLILEKNGAVVNFDEASSGELSTIASYAYIATNIQPGDFILIDEPENSLHPRWQRDYCKRIFDLFSYYEPRLVIATHSPHIVQGTKNSEINVRLIKMPEDIDAKDPLINSIEGTLFEAFGVLSPASHYLSEKVTYLINELVRGRATLAQTQQRLSDLRDISDDADQIRFLGRAIDLAAEAISLITDRRKES